MNTKGEIYFFGQIIGATAITEGDGLFVEAFFEAGDKWTFLSGNETFQTQTSYVNDDNFACFCHPFDVHYETTDCFGWPKLIVQVYKLDQTDTIDLYSYGVLILPSSPGYHEINFDTWCIHGNLSRELLGFFLDSKPIMSTSAPIAKNIEKRKSLITKPGPVVSVGIEVVTKNFGVENLRFMMKKEKEDIFEEQKKKEDEENKSKNEQK